MKKIVATLFCSLIILSLSAQKAEDLFSSGTKVTWLGLDFSHIKLIGEFSQVGGAGDASPQAIKNTFFPAWNMLIVNEQKKYDVKGMIKKEEIGYDIDMMMALNAKTPVDSMESSSYTNPNYTIDNIKKFVSKYNLEGKNGIGIAFIVESFNKPAEEAYIHFVALNMSTKEVLIHQRIKGKPMGFGLRNYWAGAIYNVIKDIRGDYYKTWKLEYGKH